MEPRRSGWWGHRRRIDRFRHLRVSIVIEPDGTASIALFTEVANIASITVRVTVTDGDSDEIGSAVTFTIARPDATRYVATDGTDAGDCSNHVVRCLTIGYALEQASPGNTVLVGPGLYSEAVTIDKAGIILQATGGPLARSSTAARPTVTIAINADDVTVVGFDVLHPGAESAMVSTGARATIRGNTFGNGNGSGLHVLGDQSLVEDNLITANGLGIEVGASDVVVRHNTISNNREWESIKKALCAISTKTTSSPVTIVGQSRLMVATRPSCATTSSAATGVV